MCLPPARSSAGNQTESEQSTPQTSRLLNGLSGATGQPLVTSAARSFSIKLPLCTKNELAVLIPFPAAHRQERVLRSRRRYLWRSDLQSYTSRATREATSR